MFAKLLNSCRVVFQFLLLILRYIQDILEVGGWNNSEIHSSLDKGML